MDEANKDKAIDTTPNPNKELTKSLQGQGGGRPTEYSDEYIEQEADALLRWLQVKGNYYLTRFFNERKLHPEHGTRFAKRSKKFCDALQLARSTMEARIVEGSMSKKFDGSFAKFVLANKAGWKEKTELSSDQANPFQVIMDRISSTNKEPIEIDVTDNDK